MLLATACTTQVGGTDSYRDDMDNEREDFIAADAAPQPDAIPPFDGACGETAGDAYFLATDGTCYEYFFAGSDWAAAKLKCRIIYGTNTRWNVMRSAIATVVSNKGDKVNFGLMIIPWKNDCRDDQVRVNPSLNNVGSILQEMNSVGPDGRPPTHQSLRRARDYFDSQPVKPDGRIVLLATDGVPVCSSIGESVNV